MSFWRHEVIQPALDAGIEAEILEQQELARIEPANPEPHYALGVMAHCQGKTEAAIRHFEKAIALDQSYAAPHVSLGRLYTTLGDDTGAWLHAREAAQRGDSSLLDQLKRYPPPRKTAAKGS